MSGLPMSEVARLVEAGGADALHRLGPGGAFLITIPTQGPYASPQASTSSSTSQFEAEILLDLKRSSRKGGQVHVYPVDCDTVVGRGEDCSVPFATDSTLSRQHASFEQEGSTWLVKDLGSRNGTFVQSTRIPSGTSKQVEAMQMVQIGGRRFVFMDADALESLLSPAESSEPILVSHLHAELNTVGPRRFLLHHSMPHLLVCVSRNDISELTPFQPLWAYPLVGKTVLRVGRTGRADITVRNTFVSKWHGVVVQKQGSWSYQDSGSSYGSRVNGRLLEARERLGLKNWDALILGRQARALFVKPRGLVEYMLDKQEEEELW